MMPQNIDKEMTATLPRGEGRESMRQADIMPIKRLQHFIECAPGSLTMVNSKDVLSFYRWKAPLTGQ